MNTPEVRVSYLPPCTWHTSVPVWRFHYWSTHVDLQMRQICIPLTTPHTKAKLILVWKKWSHINLLIHSKKTHEERVPHMHIWPINVTWYTTSALLTSGPARQTSMRFLWSCFGENEPASTVNNFAPHDQWTLVTPPPTISIKHTHPSAHTPASSLPLKVLGRAGQAYFCPVLLPKLLLESLNGLWKHTICSVPFITGGRGRWLMCAVFWQAQWQSWIHVVLTCCLLGRNSANCFSWPPLLVCAVIWKRDVGRFQMNKHYKHFICTVTKLSITFNNQRLDL